MEFALGSAFLQYFLTGEMSFRKTVVYTYLGLLLDQLFGYFDYVTAFLSVDAGGQLLNNTVEC